MSAIFHTFLGSVYWLFALPVITFAIENPINIDTIPEFIVALLKIVVQIGIPIAVFFLVYAGFLFVTASGNPEQLKKAKTALIWALIGSAVLLGALVIATAVEGTLKEIIK